jgi:hypothetical protein
MKRCLGYFETASQNKFYEFSDFNVTNTELILEAMDV